MLTVHNTMNFKLIIASLAALGLFSTVAQAQSGYAGVSVGSAEQKKSINLGLGPAAVGQDRPFEAGVVLRRRHGDAAAGHAIRAVRQAGRGAQPCRRPGPAKDDTRVLLGAGLTYMFTSTLSGVVEYEDFGKLVGGVPFTVKSRVFTLGLRASF
jgi:hypothetical protein